MSKPYKDKVNGLWKWGTNGAAIYETKEQCNNAGMEMFASKLREIREKYKRAIANHGK